MALHFSLTPSAISAIIPGARALEQITENVNASNGAGLPADIEHEIMQIRERWAG